jgi:hypothetical protein
MVMDGCFMRKDATGKIWFIGKKVLILRYCYTPFVCDSISPWPPASLPPLLRVRGNCSGSSVTFRYYQLPAI